MGQRGRDTQDQSVSRKDASRWTHCITGPRLDRLCTPQIALCDETVVVELGPGSLCSRRAQLPTQLRPSLLHRLLAPPFESVLRKLFFDDVPVMHSGCDFGEDEGEVLLVAKRDEGHGRGSRSAEKRVGGSDLRKELERVSVESLSIEQDDQSADWRMRNDPDGRD